MIRFYIALFMICSPCSAIPALLALTEGRTIQERKRVALVSSAVVGLVLVVMTWGGAAAIDFFGIRLATFQVAGGIILFLLSLSMLHGEVSKMKQSPEDLEGQKESIEIVPLAIPLMAGPGSISAVILAAGNFPGIANHFLLTLCVLLVSATLCFCLYFASFLEKKVGQTGLKVINRIGGLIISVIAVDTFSQGLCDLFPGLV